VQENGRMFLSDIHRLEKCIVTVLEALLDEKEISGLTGRAIPTLQKDHLNGEGPPFVKIGRHVRYQPSAVQAWLDKNTRKSTSDRPGIKP
jgi:predicted DNA-binding transcriptional regulator AlpA